MTDPAALPEPMSDDEAALLIARNVCCPDSCCRVGSPGGCEAMGVFGEGAQGAWAAIRDRLRAAPQAPGVRECPDTARMDWLEKRCVRVYRSRPYGTTLVLLADPPDVDACDDSPSDLRDQVDKWLATQSAGGA